MVTKDRRDVCLLDGLMAGMWRWRGLKGPEKAEGSACIRAQRLNFQERSTDRGAGEAS